MSVLFFCDHLFRVCSGWSVCSAYAVRVYLCDRLLSTCSLYSACSAYAVEVYRRASDNLIERGESAVNCLFSPLSPVFSRALFSTTLPSLGENGRAEPFPRFHEINFIPLRFVQHHGSVQLWVLHGGGWGRRKAGDWGRKPGRGRGIAAGLPPFPRVVSPSIRQNGTACAKHAEHKK